MAIELHDLTLGERLLLWRRRKKRTQVQQAKLLNVSLYKLRRWEEDDLLPGERPTPPYLGSLRAHERCLIARLRSGLSLGEAALVIGISKWWLTQIERGDAPPDRALSYWSREGRL